MDEQPAVRLVIRTYRGTRGEGQATLVRDVPMQHLPSVGDAVEVTEDGGTLLDVTRRHWNFHGIAVVYLNDIFADPGEGTHIYADERAWNTSQDGDPMELLRSSGWERTL